MPDGEDRRSFLTKMAAGTLGTGIAVGSGVSAVSAWTGTQTNSVLNHVRPDDKDNLTIVKVEPFIMRVHEDKNGKPSGGTYLFCRVETAEGIVGWGEGTNGPKLAPIAAEIEMVRPWVIGQSAFDIERTWAMIFRARNPQHGSSVQSALSAIDIALWDIVGQKLNVPVYKLLGGKVNDKIKIYRGAWGGIPRTADAYRQRTKELVAEGTEAGVVDLFFDEPDFANYSNASASHYDTNQWSRQIKRTTLNNVVEMVRGMREGGPDMDIGVMAHARYNVNSAIRLTKALEPFDLMWLEEPVPPGNIDAAVQVQSQSSIPVAMGNRLKSRLEVREYIERGGLRVLQPDCARIGGITEFRKVASWAETHWIPVTPHNPNGPVCLAANLALATSMSNFMILEEGSTDTALNKEIFAGGWQDSPSHFMPRETPGLGIKFSDDFVRAHAMDISTAERSG